MTLISNIYFSAAIKVPGIIEWVSVQEPIILSTVWVYVYNLPSPLLNIFIKTNVSYDNKPKKQILVIEQKYEMFIKLKLSIVSSEQILFQKQLFILQKNKKDIFLFFLDNEMQYFAHIRKFISKEFSHFLLQHTNDELTKFPLIQRINSKFLQFQRRFNSKILTHLKQFNQKRIIGVLVVIISVKFIFGFSYIVALCEGLSKESQTIAIRTVELLAIKHEIMKRDTAADILMYTGKKLYLVFEKLLFENNLDSEPNRLRLQRWGLIEGRVKLLRLYERLGRPESLQNAVKTTELLSSMYPQVCREIQNRGLHSVGSRDAIELYNSVKQYAVAETHQNSSFYNPSTTLSLDSAIPPVTVPSNIPPISTGGVTVDCLSTAIDILSNSTIATISISVGGAIFMSAMVLVKQFKE